MKGHPHRQFTDRKQGPIDEINLQNYDNQSLGQAEQEILLQN